MSEQNIPRKLNDFSEYFMFLVEFLVKIREDSKRRNWCTLKVRKVFFFPVYVSY